MVKLLLRHGADANIAEGFEDETPIFMSQSLQVAELLIAHGADLSARLNNGEGILDACNDDVLPALQAALDPRSKEEQRREDIKQ